MGDNDATTPAAILDACKAAVKAGSKSGYPTTSGAVKTQISRLKSSLDRYFKGESHWDGRNEDIRVEIEDETYVLQFQQMYRLDEDVFQFWEPYFNSFHTTMLYYPEPPVFSDRQNNYFRSPDANSHLSDTHFKSLLKDDHGALFPSFSLVPSGIVAAMALLADCFHINKSRLKAKALQTGQKLPAHTENVILLGTPTTSLDALRSIEMTSPMYTAWLGKQNQFVVSGKTYIDQSQKEDPAEAELKKFSILTRRIEPGGRIVTALSGHSRSIQGVAEMLTNVPIEQDQKIAQLKRIFKGAYPKEFQAFFEVRMLKNSGNLEITSRKTLRGNGLKVPKA